MRKRSGRPPRYAAVPNETIDDAPSLDFMALALLTVMLRHQDGWEITLAEIGKKYGYGRDALARAMGLLQVARYVVKVRIMSVGDNQWSTEVIVFDTPATDAEVDELLASTARDPQVRMVQLVVPTAAAVEHAASRREKLGPKRRQGPTASVPARAGDDSASDGPAAGKKERSRKSAAGAPAKTNAPKGKPGMRLSQDLAAAVRMVEAAWPAELASLLPKYRPQVLRDAILQALDSRTAQQLAERVGRRWTEHGYAVDAMPGGKGLGSPIGVAVALVRPPADCPEPMCEDGMVLDRGEPCRACAVRRGDRRGSGSGSPVPMQRAGAGGEAPDWWQCHECSAPGRGTGPVDGLCRECRADAAVATAAAEKLAADCAAEEAERARLASEAWDALLEDAYAEHAVREVKTADRRARQEERQRRRQADKEETRLLREQIAQEHPELAALTQP